MEAEIKSSLEEHYKVSFLVKKPINVRGVACGVGSVITLSDKERGHIARVAGCGVNYVKTLPEPEAEKIVPFGSAPKKKRARTKPDPDPVPPAE